MDNLPSRDEFMKYYKIQQGGKYNMIVNAKDAIFASGLTEDKYYDIIRNYNECYKKYIQGINLDELKPKDKKYNFSERLNKLYK